MNFRRETKDQPRFNTKTTYNFTLTTGGSVKTETDLLSLAEQCEGAAGPSRDIDLSIMRYAMNIGGPSDTAERYTASIDAALTLVPEGCEYRLERRHSKGMHPAYASIWSVGGRDIDHHDNAHGKTEALAICAAALKARALAPIDARSGETRSGSIPKGRKRD